jgi:hypothetical protein
MKFHRSFIVLWLAVGTGAACTPAPNPNLDTQSLSSPDALFPIGVSREDLRRRGSLGWEFLHDTEPTDPFAKLTVWQMVAQRKPRPTSFERFILATEPGVRHIDYVFYDSQSRIIYVARKTDRD